MAWLLPLGLPTASPGLAPGRRRLPTLSETHIPALPVVQSLYYRGLSDPSDVVQHCLTLFRRARVPDIVHFLAVPPGQAGPPCRVAVGGQEVQETGPLAPLAGGCVRVARHEAGSTMARCWYSSHVQESQGAAADGSAQTLSMRRAFCGCWQQGSRPPAAAHTPAARAGVLDVGARRVLPGHLLRRSRVLSTLRLGGSFQQRVALTACTGEESVFEWTLHRAGGDTGGGEAGASSESSDDEGGSGLMQEQQRRQEQLQLLQRSWDAGSDSEGESDGGGGRRWVVATIRRDGSCDSPLPTTPHPK